MYCTRPQLQAVQEPYACHSQERRAPAHRGARSPRNARGALKGTVRASSSLLVSSANSTRRSSVFQRTAARTRTTAAASAVADGEAGDSSAAATPKSQLIQTDVLAGITVALALVPEAVAFTFVAGVNPIVGLHGAVLMCAITSLLGGRPGMISGAAGATAVVTGPLVASHGVEYLFACMALAGCMQLLFGAARLGKVIRLVPRGAMLGFVNGLAIVILSAQAQHFQVLNAAGAAVWMTGIPLLSMIGLVLLTMLIIEVFPRLTKVIPAPLVAIGGVTTLVQTLGINTKTLGDMSTISGTLPSFHLPDVALSFQSLELLAPYAAAVAAVGLIETLLTQNLVDEITQTRTPTHTECLAQGLANVVNGFFGGMGGCAMIGQTIININSGGRGRLSGLTCAACIAAFILVLSNQIEKIPLAALVGVMIKVVIDTFAWKSVTILRKIPKTDAFVLIAVTCITVYSNLAVAVILGVIISALGFAYKQSQKIDALRTYDPQGYGGQGAAVYTLSGPLFFGSVLGFKDLIDPAQETETEVVLDFINCRVWDQSALEAIDTLSTRFDESGKRVHLRHLSRDCRFLLAKAGNLVELNLMEDPTYAVATDYTEEAISSLGANSH